jgi:hypothetical protein
MTTNFTNAIMLDHDEIVKRQKTVTPAQAGVQNSLYLLDSRFRGNDNNGEIATLDDTFNH